MIKTLIVAVNAFISAIYCRYGNGCPFGQHLRAGGKGPRQNVRQRMSRNELTEWAGFPYRQSIAGNICVHTDKSEFFLSLTSSRQAFYSLYMTDIENFDRLVSGLSLGERQNLLEKLKGNSSLSNEPLYVGENNSFSAVDIEEEFSALPWYNRIWYFILSLFKSTEPIRIYEDHQISALGEKIEEKSPGLYDYQKGFLLSPFYRQVEKLKEAARFFYTALDISVNKDKGAFFAFLGSLEMPNVHKRLQAEADPNVIVDKYPDTPDAELRQMSVKAMDNALTMVTEDHREIMYFDARSLNCLKELSSFLFDRILMAFGTHSSGNGGSCSTSLVRELLITLNDILLSLRAVPPMPLLESLFVFILQEKSDEQGFDINRDIRSLLVKAEESLAVIREFNRNVPLTWIIRCSVRNMSYSPKEISGGEEWFIVYRDYWKQRIESLLAAYIKDRRHDELQSSFHTFLKGKSPKRLMNTKSDSNPEGLPLRGGFGLSFLYTFYSAVFLPDVNKFLRQILIDGEFINKENHAEFVESYNNLIKLEDDIKKLEKEISHSGDYGKRYARARQDMSSLSVKRRKLQIVIQEASENAEKILEQTKAASQSMMNIINGILGRDSRSKYDTLVNLAKLGGRDSQFNVGLSESVTVFQIVIKLLDEIEVMEYGR